MALSRAVLLLRVDAPLWPCSAGETCSMCMLGKGAQEESGKSAMLASYSQEGAFCL